MKVCPPHHDRKQERQRPATGNAKADGYESERLTARSRGDLSVKKYSAPGSSTPASIGSDVSVIVRQVLQDNQPKTKE